MRIVALGAKETQALFENFVRNFSDAAAAWDDDMRKRLVDADVPDDAGIQACYRAALQCAMMVGRRGSSPRGGPSPSRYLRGALTLGWDVCSGASPRAYRVRSVAPLPHIIGPHRRISRLHDCLLSASLCLPLHLPLFLFFFKPVWLLRRCYCCPPSVGKLFLSHISVGRDSGATAAPAQ